MTEGGANNLRADPTFLGPSSVQLLVSSTSTIFHREGGYQTGRSIMR